MDARSDRPEHVLVGRERELSTLDTTLAAAVSGHGQLVLLSGEPGVGKTRLVAALAARAQQQGVLALWATCWEGEGMPAFWPWQQLVREYARVCDVARLRTELELGAIDVVRMVPELTTRVPNLVTPPPFGGEHDRFRVFDAVTTLFKSASTYQPLLLVVDDIQWSDAPSALLLRFLARELRSARILVLATYRDTDLHVRHPLARVVADLSREAHHLVLRGLDEAAVRELVHLVAGEAPAPDTVDAIYRQTSGNPLFVRELVLFLGTNAGRSVAEQPGGIATPVPMGVQQVIEQRFHQLSPACCTLLATAATIGQEFWMNVLEEMSRQPREAVLELLDSAVEARLVEETGLPGRYRFAHALVRETLYAGLTGRQRRALHQLVGETFEHEIHQDMGPLYPELAAHFLGAGLIDKAIHYGALAGEWAFSVSAYEVAVVHLGRVLQLVEKHQPNDGAYACELLLRFGEAQKAAGDLAGARASFEQAGTLAQQIEAGEFLARAALGVGVEFTAGEVNQLEVRLLETALNLLDDADSPLRARVMARRVR
ncbi:MAG: DUF2791 family P-loop domain-containing protein, partial [Chloroflexi bacterium]|nr:DUF2791 family P-loop domain-containing protein [Chloroflexota bacterium]